MSVGVIALLVGGVGLLISFLFMRKRSKEMDARDKRIVLREDKIATAKKKLEIVKEVTNNKNEEYKDALKDYNSKYRPGK